MIPTLLQLGFDQRLSIAYLSVRYNHRREIKHHKQCFLQLWAYVREDFYKDLSKMTFVEYLLQFQANQPTVLVFYRGEIVGKLNRGILAKPNYDFSLFIADVCLSNLEYYLRFPFSIVKYYSHKINIQSNFHLIITSSNFLKYIYFSFLKQVIYQQQYMQAIGQSIIQSSIKRFIVLILTNISFSLYFYHMDKFLNIFRFNEPSINIQQALEILLFNMLHFQLYSSLLRTKFVYEHYSIYILCSAVLRYIYYVFLKRQIQDALGKIYLVLTQLDINIEIIGFTIVFIMAIAGIFYLKRQRNNQRKRGKLILGPHRSLLIDK